MADYKDVVRLAVDAYHGKQERYSTDESMNVLHQALIEANNGKTYLDYKDIRDGKCVGLFSIMEEVLSRTIVEGLQGDEWFNTISTIKAFEQFGISANNSMLIIDKFNEVGNNFAISSEGIGTALQKSASALAAANNDLDQSVALVAAMNSVLQNPEQVGKLLPNNAVMY